MRTMYTCIYCIYIYMYIYIHTHTHIYIYIYILVDMAVSRNWGAVRAGFTAPLKGIRH